MTCSSLIYQAPGFRGDAGDLPSLAFVPPSHGLDSSPSAPMRPFLPCTRMVSVKIDRSRRTHPPLLVQSRET